MGRERERGGDSAQRNTLIQAFIPACGLYDHYGRGRERERGLYFRDLRTWI